MELKNRKHMKLKLIVFLFFLVGHVSHFYSSDSQKHCSRFSCFAAMLQRHRKTSKQERSMLLKPEVKQYAECPFCHSRQMKFRLLPLFGPHFFALPAKTK